MSLSDLWGPLRQVYPLPWKETHPKWNESFGFLAKLHNAAKVIWSMKRDGMVVHVSPFRARVVNPRSA